MAAPPVLAQTFQPSALRPEQVEAIWTMTGLGKRPKEIAREIGLHVETVRKYLASLQSGDANMRHALMSSRAQRARAYSEYLAQKAICVLETIDTTALKQSSVQQRGVLAGILVDKAKVMGDRAQDLETWVDDSAARGGKVASRTNIETLMESIKGRVERLTFLQVDMPSGMLDKLKSVEAQVLEVKDGNSCIAGTPAGARRRAPARRSSDGHADRTGQEAEERPEDCDDVSEGGDGGALGRATFVPAVGESDGHGASPLIESPAAYTEIESAAEEKGVSAAGTSFSEETDGTS